jgi:hypothetical protein
MAYEQKFQLVRDSLILHCKKCIRTNWEQMFDMWLSIDAGMDFGHAYQDKFKEEFSRYMNSDIETNLFIAGKNVVFAIGAFMAYKKSAKLNDILEFTELFMSEQLDDFTNWCDEISQAMYEETSEYEREFGVRNEEDNPS